MSHKSKQEEIIRHESSDEFYVDDENRRCPQCLEVKMLFAFRPEGGDTVPRRKYDIVALCNLCRDEIRTAHSQQRAVSKLAAVEKEKVVATQEIVTVLNNVTKRRALENACPDPADGINHMMERMGGEKATWDKIADAMQDGLENAKPDTKVKAGSALMKFVADVHKAQAPTPELGDITPEEARQFMRGPAIRFLTTDDEFRREVLNDPDVRRAILEDLGITVLDQDVADKNAAEVLA